MIDIYLLNLGYRRTNQELVDGVIVNASGVQKEQMSRRNPFEGKEWVLFDPQMYLKNLEYNKSKNICNKLSTYPWFGGSSIEFNSVEINLKTWFEQHKETVEWDNNLPIDNDAIKACIKECLDFQLNFGVSHLIVPTPIIENTEDDYALQIKWIDLLEEVTEESDYELPLLITLAFYDHIFMHEKPSKNKLIQTMMDNLTVRDYISGIYLVPICNETTNKSKKIENKYVAESLLYICDVIAKNELITVVNYVDEFGMACLSAGADAFGSGYTNKERRMCFSDFEDGGGGGPLPRFYSNNLLMDLLSNRDLSKLKNSNLLRLIKPDITDESQGLYEELNNGGITNNVPNWRETVNNVTSATKHRILCMYQFADQLTDLEEWEERESFLLEWLQNAEAYRLLLESRLAGNLLSTNNKYIAVWLSSYENYLEDKEN